MDKFMHNYCLHFVFLLFHFFPQKSFWQLLQKIIYWRENQTPCLCNMPAEVDQRGTTRVIFNISRGLILDHRSDIYWLSLKRKLVKYQLFDVDQLVNKSYHTQHKQWGPKSTNGKYKQVKPKDTRSTQYVKFTQVPNKKNTNQLYRLPSKKKNLNVSLTFSIHAYLFFLPSVL